MFKSFPEAEFIVNKSASTIASTIEFNTVLFTQSLEYLNKITDKMFYAWTVQAADTINTVSDHAKENITQSAEKVVKLFSNSK
jgi:hypothetical protein